MPANATAASLPNTCTATIVSASHLRRVDLARHDRRAGLVVGDRDLADARARPARVPAHVVGDLHQRAGERAQRARSTLTIASCADSAANLFARRRERLAGFAARCAARHRLAEARMRVEAGADRRAAERERIQPLSRARDAGAARRRAARPSRRSPGRASPASRPAGACGRSSRRRRTRAPSRRACRAAARAPAAARGRAPRPSRCASRPGNASFDDWPRLTSSFGCIGFLRADDAAGELDRAIGDHLVRVHVGLRAGAGLEHDQRKLGVELAVDHFLRRARDQLGLVVRAARRARALASAAAFLSRPNARITGRPQRKRVDADREVVDRALRLRAPQVVGGHAHFAERVLLDALRRRHAASLGHERDATPAYARSRERAALAAAAGCAVRAAPCAPRRSPPPASAPACAARRAARAGARRARDPLSSESNTRVQLLADRRRCARAAAASASPARGSNSTTSVSSCSSRRQLVLVDVRAARRSARAARACCSICASVRLPPPALTISMPVRTIASRQSALVDLVQHLRAPPAARADRSASCLRIAVALVGHLQRHHVAVDLEERRLATSRRAGRDTGRATRSRIPRASCSARRPSLSARARPPLRAHHRRPRAGSAASIGLRPRTTSAARAADAIRAAPSRATRASPRARAGRTSSSYARSVSSDSAATASNGFSSTRSYFCSRFRSSSLRSCSVTSYSTSPSAPVVLVDLHAVQARRQLLDVLQHLDDLRVLLLRDLAGHEDAEVADVLVDQPDDRLAVRLDLLGATSRCRRSS